MKKQKVPEIEEYIEIEPLVIFGAGSLFGFILMFFLLVLFT